MRLSQHVDTRGNMLTRCQPAEIPVEIESSGGEEGDEEEASEEEVDVPVPPKGRVKKVGKKVCAHRDTPGDMLMSC